MNQDMVSEQFGTLRGLVRLGLAYAETGVGLAPTSAPALDGVSRLVFVCHGNICRSAFAEAAARKMGMNAASFGLSTKSGQPAYPSAVAYAGLSGLDLSGHKTTAKEDFLPAEGDLLLAMEVRQLRRLRADQRLSHMPRALLGSYAPIPIPHLHDPYELSEAYLKVCLDRIERAVSALRDAYPGARAS